MRTSSLAGLALASLLAVTGSADADDHPPGLDAVLAAHAAAGAGETADHVEAGHLIHAVAERIGDYELPPEVATILGAMSGQTEALLGEARLADARGKRTANLTKWVVGSEAEVFPRRDGTTGGVTAYGKPDLAELTIEHPGGRAFTRLTLRGSGQRAELVLERPGQAGRAFRVRRVRPRR